VEHVETFTDANLASELNRVCLFILAQRELAEEAGCGVDLNHRPLGYECHHQQNLKTMRDAKSAVLFLGRANRTFTCPRFALVICPKSRTVVPAHWPWRQIVLVEREFTA